MSWIPCPALPKTNKKLPSKNFNELVNGIQKCIKYTSESKLKIAGPTLGWCPTLKCTGYQEHNLGVLVLCLCFQYSRTQYNKEKSSPPRHSSVTEIVVLRSA